MSSVIIFGLYKEVWITCDSCSLQKFSDARHLSWRTSGLGRNVIRNDAQPQVTFTNVTFTKSIGVDFEGIFVGGHQCSGGQTVS